MDTVITRNSAPAIWFLVGLQDRCLVMIYRDQIREAAHRPETLSVAGGDYRFVGDTSAATRARMLTSGQLGRWERAELRSYFQVRRLAHGFPLAALLTWVVLMIANRS